MYQTISTATHTAHLDPVLGFGLLVRPVLGHDVPSPVVGPSLHEADWTVMVRQLARLGWEPAESDDIPDVPSVAGFTADGREVVELIADEPLVDRPSIEQLAEVETVLRRAAGLA